MGAVVAETPADVALGDTALLVDVRRPLAPQAKRSAARDDDEDEFTGDAQLVRDVVKSHAPLEPQYRCPRYSTEAEAAVDAPPLSIDTSRIVP